MASSSDNEETDEAAESDVDLSGRLRNPGPNTTEIEPHGEDDDAVDNLGDRLRSKPPGMDSEEGDSLDEQPESEEVESEENLEDSLLDALDSEAEESGGSPGAGREVSEVGTPGPSSRDGDGTSPGTGDSGPDVDLEEAPERSRERTTERRAPEADEAEESSGETEEAGQVCEECDSVSPSGMRFCVQCGASLRDGDPDRDDEEAPAVDRDKLDDEIAPGFALVAINDDGTDGKSIPLESSETLIGRDGDTRFPTDEFLDPRHSRLTVEDGDLYLEDLNSLNGTYVKLQNQVRLRPGDTFLMGRQVLRFERIEQDLDSKKTDEDGTRYMGSPAPGGEYKILQIGVGELVQNIYCLPDSGVVLGREKGDIIFPRDKFMSGRHARILTEDEPFLVDLNSSNGTWIKIWEKRELDEDDYVFMGQQLFRVELPD